MFTRVQHCHHSLKGAAAIAGIFSLLLLQLGFTVFLRTTDLLEKSAEIARSADVPFYPLIPLELPVALISNEDLETHSSIPDREISITRASFRADHASYRKGQPTNRQLARMTTRRPSKPISDAPFRDTIIEIRSVASDTRRVSVSDEPVLVSPTRGGDGRKPDKRSFLATISPLVKKPYGWVKAIGSKLF